MIRRRLLVNAVVDPDEAAVRLPPGLSPHVGSEGTVVGCCLLDLDAVRPAGLPAGLGRTMRATAHRISVEWEDPAGRRLVGVYVPVRHTDSRLAAALGGRWFPGVHRRATIGLTVTAGRLRWWSEPSVAGGSAIRVVADLADVAGEHTAGACDDQVGATCRRAAVGVSPGHTGRLEATRMDLSHRHARPVTIEEVESDFIAGFSTARPAPSFLMTSADVTWSRAAAPEGEGTGGVRAVANVGECASSACRVTGARAVPKRSVVTA